VQRPVDPVAEPVSGLVRQRGVQVPEHDPHEHVPLAGPGAEPGDRRRGQLLARRVGQHRDTLDAARVRAESIPDPVAERLLVLSGRYGDGQVARDRRHHRDPLIRREVEHLAGDPGIAGAKQADVGDALGEHEQPVQPHAEGEPASLAQPGGGQDTRVGVPALPDLHPAAVVAHVGLPAAQGVRMRPRLPSPRHAWGERAQQGGDHLVHVGAAHRPARDPPQVQLVRGAGVLPVDGVPAVHYPGADQQHVIRGVSGIGGEATQRGRDHGARMAAEHAPRVYVPGVSSFPGDRAGWVPEPVVVVGDRDDPAAAAPSDFAVPCPGQAFDGFVDEDLDSVRAFRGIGQIPYGKIAS
jgi:hypothetical protein